LLAYLAHDRKRPDTYFEAALPLIREHAHDGRNFVKKAVNWALREIGKRSPALRVKAIAMAETIYADGTPAGRWIARDALRELRSDALDARMAARFTQTS
jgi:3-methyladenine DNA glycosylase AlkD